MDSTRFSKSFRFCRYSYEKYHYTDCSRGAPSHFVAYMESGRCKIVSERGTREFAAGDVFYIPMGLQYKSYWYGDPKISFLSYGFSSFPEAEQKHFCLQKIPCSSDLAREFYTIPINTPVDCEILGRFYSALAKAIPTMRTGSFNNAKRVYRDAMEFLSAHPLCTVSQMAKACNVSESMLYAVFRKVAGKSPNSLRQELLVDRAVQLLITTDRQVQEISDTLGFSSVSYFRKILKSYTGKTPSEIRKDASVF